MLPLDLDPYTSPREKQVIPDSQPQVAGLKNLRPLAYLSCSLYVLTTFGSWLVVKFFPEFTSPRTHYLVYLTLSSASIMSFLAWTYRAAGNARRIDSNDMPLNPGKAVWGYFIPLANFVIPFRAMRGIARASIGRGSDGHVIIWWVLTSIRVIFPANLLLFVDLLAWERTSFASILVGKTFSVIGWGLLVTGVLLVLRITRAQEEIRRGFSS
jgi:hypothetical protein